MAKTKKEKPLNPPSPLLVTPEIQDKQEVPEIVIDYDGLWKLIIEAFFFEFTAFFLPKLFKDIDRMLIFVDQVLALPIHLQTTFMENVVNKKSGRKRLPIEDKLEQSHRDFFKAFFTAQMGVEPDVYFAQQKAALDQAVKEAAAQAEAAAAATAKKQVENEKLINQIYVAIQMHRQLDLEVAKVALVMNMPLDEIRLIFKYKQQKNITAELLLPIFQQYRDAKQANPKIDPMTWEYMERPQ
jgi:hypothetical protein